MDNLFFKILFLFLSVTSAACEPDTTVQFVTDKLATRDELTVTTSNLTPPYRYGASPTDFFTDKTMPYRAIRDTGQQIVVIWEGGTQTCRSTLVNIGYKNVLIIRGTSILYRDSLLFYHKAFKIND